MRNLFWILAALTPLIAETPAPVGGPVLGSVYDSASGRVRSLAGIPASAVLAAPETEGPALGLAVAAPGQPFAIGVEAETGAAVLVSGTERIELAGVHSGATRIAVSPRGHSAALYFAETSSVQIVTGLPERARVSREVPLAGALTALAVSDKGDALLAALEEEDGAMLAMDHAVDGYRSYGKVGALSALDFFPDSTDAVYANASSVWMIRNGQVHLVMGEDDGISEVTGVAASADGSAVFAAMRSGQIAIRKLSTGERTAVTCWCQPDGLARLRGNAVFRLNGPGEGPVWILDAGGEEPRIFFVAAPPRGDQ